MKSTVDSTLESIHILRGIAAMLVVLFHTRVFFDYLIPGLGNIFEGGYAGVDIFFIISGFVICYSTQRRQGAGQFLVRRLFRVWLPAVVASTMYVVVTSRAMSAQDWMMLLTLAPREIMGSPYYGHGVFFIIWTVAYELCFYALFALALACSHLWRAQLSLVFVLVAFTLGQWCLSGVITVDPYKVQESSWVFLPQYLHKGILLASNPMMLMFCVGMMFFLLYERARALLVKIDSFWLAIASAMLGLGSLYGYFLPARGHGLLNIGLFAIASFVAFLVLQQLIDRNRVRGRSANPALMWLGTISYSLYLCHPIVMELRYIVPAFSSLNLMSVPLLMLFSIVLASALFYRCIELPAQQLGRHIANRLNVRR